MNPNPALAQPSHTDNAWLGAWRSAQREPVFFSDDPHVGRMLEATWQRDRVQFRYWGGSIPGQTRRVTPGAVFTVAGSTGVYVEAECHLRAELRVFRLDRVEWSAE